MSDFFYHVSPTGHEAALDHDRGTWSPLDDLDEEPHTDHIVASAPRTAARLDSKSLKIAPTIDCSDMPELQSDSESDDST